MSFGRRTGIWFLSALLGFLLWVTAVDFGLIHIIGSPTQIETTLNKSGLYSSIVPSLLDQAQTISSVNGDIPLSDPIVRSAATATLTPKFLQTNVNQALDSIYNWLNGKTDQPKFSINLTEVRNNFADKVAAGAEQKAASLPVCTAVAVSSSIDVFHATCLPAGVSPAQISEQVKSSVISGQGFLDKPSISASDIKTVPTCTPPPGGGDSQCPPENKSQPFFTKNNQLPKVYQGVKISPVVLILLILVLVALTVFVYQPKRKGLRHVGFVTGGVGLLVVLFALGLNEAVSNKVIHKLTLNNSVLQTSLSNIIRDLAHSLDKTLTIIGAIYIVLAAIAVGTAYYLEKRQPASADETKSSDTPKTVPVIALKAPDKKIKIK